MKRMEKEQFEQRMEGLAEYEAELGHELGQEQQVENEDELIQLMHRKFLAGEDEGFDYSQVDHNPKYDNVEQIA